MSHTEAEEMAGMWFGEIPSCCFLTVLLGPAWVLLNYVLQTIFSGPVHPVAVLHVSAIFPQSSFEIDGALSRLATQIGLCT